MTIMETYNSVNMNTPYMQKLRALREERKDWTVDERKERIWKRYVNELEETGIIKIRTDVQHEQITATLQEHWPENYNESGELRKRWTIQDIIKRLTA